MALFAISIDVILPSTILLASTEFPASFNRVILPSPIRAIGRVPVEILLALSHVIVVPSIYAGSTVPHVPIIERYLVPIFPSGRNIFDIISPIDHFG